MTEHHKDAEAMAAAARENGPFTLEGEGVRGTGTVALVAPSEPGWYGAMILELRDILNTVHRRGAPEHDLKGEPRGDAAGGTGHIFEVRPDE
jgi:hypothetical protein